MNFLKYTGSFFPFPCQVSDGELANAVTFNSQLASLETSNTMLGEQNLHNTTPASGPDVDNAQKEINGLDSFTGRVGGDTYNSLPVWTNNDVGASTDDLKTRADSLTAAFDNATGHAHGGATGDGAPIDAADLSNVNNFFGQFAGPKNIVTVSGLSTIVTTDFALETAGGSTTVEGVVTDPPSNRVVIIDELGEFLENAAGDRVYGRLTFAATVWTLTYFVVTAGVETAYSIPAPIDINIYYKKTYSQANRPTFGADFGDFFTADMTSEIVDASATQRGVVSTGVQSFAGAKTFTGAISASNLSGTNSGDVTLAVIGSAPNANGASLSGQAVTLQPADSTFGGVLTAIAQSILGLKTFISGVVAQTVFRTEGKVETDSANDATTGSGVTLSLPAKEVVRLTSGTLVSVAGITAPSNKQKLIIINRTGVAITIINDATATAADRFLTGTGVDLTLAINASISLVYDTTTSRWEIVGGSGSTSPLTTKGDIFTYSTINARLPVGTNNQVLAANSATATGLEWQTLTSGSLTIFATANISAAGTITAAAGQRELRRIQGNAAAVTADTTTPITAGTTEGQELILKGMSDTNTVTIQNSGNVTLNGDMVLYASSVLSLVWIDSKWLEIARKI